MVEQYEAHRNGKLSLPEVLSNRPTAEPMRVQVEQDDERFTRLVGDGDDISLSELGKESASDEESLLSDISDDSDTEATARSLRTEFWLLDSRLACQRVKRWQSSCVSGGQAHR